ncbi:MAG: flippase-like domain-containing protein [Halobacteriota archaeon]|nr:flippase-like domain-containing protein [Halobacteriota archaeon]
MNSVKRSLLITILISIVSVGLVLWLTMSIDDPIDLSKIDPFYLLLALSFHVGSWFFWSERMKILVEASGGHLSFPKSFKILVSCFFAAGITPSEVGGEPVKIYLLTEENMTFGDATAVVVTERFLDVIFLVLISPLGLFIFRDLVLSGGLIVIPIIAVSFFVSVFSLLVLIIYRPEMVKSISTILFDIVLEIWRTERMQRLISRILKEIGSFIDGMWIISRKRSELTLASGCTVARWLIDLCVAPLILMGLGSEPYFIHSFAAQILLVVLLLAPITPGGSGIAEIGSAAIFSTFVKGAPVGLFVVIFRLITYHVNLIVGAVASIIALKDLKIIKNILDLD